LLFGAVSSLSLFNFGSGYSLQVRHRGLAQGFTAASILSGVEGYPPARDQNIFFQHTALIAFHHLQNIIRQLAPFLP
jgi:hypothetical protein